MKKVLFVATVVKTHIMEFHIPYLKMFQDLGWETSVAARNDYENLSECKIPYCDHYFEIPFERNPVNISNIKAYLKLKKIISNGHYQIIHCHTPVGAFLSRIAARKARKEGTKVIYTAHGFHFYKGAPLINWLIYYPIEKCLAHYTDVLITINKEDYERAKAFKTKKVCYIPGVGIDTKKFKRTAGLKEKKREELKLKLSDIVLLSVGELIERKNHKVVIRALAYIKKKGMLDNFQYIICGQGILETELKNMALDLGVSQHVQFLGYRSDVADICNCSDIFLFMSFQEGLPVALMEAMACGLPVICSNIRGNRDLIINNVNGLIIENSPESVAASILKMSKSYDLRKKMADEALCGVREYDINNVKKQMKEIYELY